MFRSRFRQYCGLCCAAALLCVSASVADAKRPPAPDVEPTEVIYFAYAGDTLQMEADGGGKVGLNLGYWGAHFEPSHAPHGGKRWFLHEVGNSVAAMNEDGTLILLFTPPPADANGNYWRVGGNLRWVFDGANQDGSVSWHYELVSIREDGTSEVLHQEVVRASVIYDPVTGGITGLDPNSIDRFPTIPSSYDWSPDGTMIVFNDQGVLWIFDTEPPTQQQSLSLLPIAQVFGSPAWSPDARKIAYGIVDREQDVSRIETFGLADGVIIGIAEGRLQSPLDGIVVYYPHWSPDSASLLYQLQDVRGYSDTTHIIKKSASGKGKATDLTVDLNLGISHRPWIYGWRLK